MATVATVPVTISPEAALRIQQLGRQREVERMLEHARQTVPGLLGLDVQLVEPYDLGGEDHVLIWVKKPEPPRTRTTRSSGS
jgi:hypothetical protein